MTKFIIKETKESFDSIHELRQHAIVEGISKYTLIVKSNDDFNNDRELLKDTTQQRGIN